MSFGIGVGMVLAGWIGSVSSRRGLVLLIGTGMSVLALIALLQLPNAMGGLLLLAALGMVLGLDPRSWRSRLLKTQHLRVKPASSWPS